MSTTTSSTHDLARLIDDLAPRFTALSDTIWDNPELRWDEAASAENHIELARSEGLLTGSTDVGDVSWVTPTVQCTTACVTRGTPAHSWQLVAQGKLPAAHKGMLHAAKTMAGTAMNLLTDPTLLKLAKEEFVERTTKQSYDSPIPDGVIAPPLR